MNQTATSMNKSPGAIFRWIERVGNKIPNPFILFVYLLAILMVALQYCLGSIYPSKIPLTVNWFRLRIY